MMGRCYKFHKNGQILNCLVLDRNYFAGEPTHRCIAFAKKDLEKIIAYVEKYTSFQEELKIPEMIAKGNTLSPEDRQQYAELITSYGEPAVIFAKDAGHETAEAIRAFIEITKCHLY